MPLLPPQPPQRPPLPLRLPPLPPPPLLPPQRLLSLWTAALRAVRVYYGTL